MEHYKGHYRWNWELNQFCHSHISKYLVNSYRCIRHYPVWTGSRSWVPRYHSLHIRITGDGVRARIAAFSLRIFKNLLILNVYPGVMVYNRLMIFSTINAKTSWSNTTKFISNHWNQMPSFGIAKNGENPISFEQGCSDDHIGHCVTVHRNCVLSYDQNSYWTQRY